MCRQLNIDHFWPLILPIFARFDPKIDPYLEMDLSEGMLHVACFSEVIIKIAKKSYFESEFGGFMY